MTNKQAPDALLLLATGCAHCPAVLEGLSQLLKQGRIGRLEAVNIMQHPAAAQAVGARSVPWTRIGRFELTGAMTPGELAEWVELAQSEQGFGVYFSHLLESQQPHKVTALLREIPETLPQLVALLQSDATPMTVRIGIGVVLEELEESGLLQHALPELIAQARSSQPNIRADAAHYLGLTHAEAAAGVLRELLSDENPDVREIAEESLQRLQSGPA